MWFFCFQSRIKMFKVPFWLEKSVWICVGTHVTIRNIFESIPLHSIPVIIWVGFIFVRQFILQRYFYSIFISLSKVSSINFLFFLRGIKGGRIELHAMNDLARKKQTRSQIYKILTNCICGHSELKQLSLLMAYINIWNANQLIQYPIFHSIF